MSKVICNREDIVAIADAVRNKLNSNDALTLGGIVSGIESIGGIDTTDATATASDIFDGKTAYTNGEKVTGTFTIEEELTQQNDLISQIATLVATKANPQGGGSGESANKLAQVTSRTVTEITAKDLEGAPSIPDYFFWHCNALTSVVIPDSVTRIQQFAFADCTALTSAIIGNSVNYIGDSAFRSCSGLLSIIIPNGVTRINNYTFYECTALTSVIVPNSVTEIGTTVFNNCKNLTSIIIPDSVIKIANNVFYGCKSLPSVNIPDGVTKIDTYTFYGCSSLESVIVGSGVTSIGNYAFGDCQKMNSFTIKAETPPTILTSTFYAVPADCAIFVPALALEAYKNATNWSARADYIFPIEEE